MAVEAKTLMPEYGHPIPNTFQGNFMSFPIRVEIPAGAVAGDTLTTEKVFDGGLIYAGFEVRSDAANTAGLQLDIGYVGARQDVGADDLVAFVDGHTVIAGARSQAMTGLSVPMVLPDRQIDHRLAFTLAGTVTAGESVEVWVQSTHKGAI